ncbi:MAG: ribonuclease Z [Desulfobacterales bacterium]|nr:ribonuclease Z [Desulfobacterales bacterium]
MFTRFFIALGTACLVPTRKRNHNGYFLKWDKEGFLFDPGEGTQRQLEIAGISVFDITKIFITHFHGDHCLGLPGILQKISINRVPHTIELYYPETGQKYINHLKEASVFHNFAQINECAIQHQGVIFKNQQLQIRALSLDHPIDTFGYRIQEYDTISIIPEKIANLGLSGQEIGRLKKEGQIEHNQQIIHLSDVGIPKKGQSIAFIMDTCYCDAAVELAENVNLMVCESTYLSQDSALASQNKHLTALQAAEIAHKANAKQLVLTHFSNRYLNIVDFADEAKKIHLNSVAVQDGDCIEIPLQKRFEPEPS